MVMPSMSHSPIRRSDGEASAVEFTTASIPVFGGFIHYLVKGRVDVICKLDLSYWGVARSCCSNSESNNALQLTVLSLQCRCVSHNIELTCRAIFTCSDRGVLKTLSLPKRCNSPAVHLKTPPKLTSSPNTRALWSIQTSANNKHNMDILFDDQRNCIAPFVVV